jgi:hypothetical protein
VLTKEVYLTMNSSKYYKVLFLFCFICIVFTACNQNNTTILGLDYAKSELQNALNDSASEQILVGTVISDKETAIKVSEAILFRIYGKENVINERPYEINFINGYWVLGGTLPKGMKGGTFLIILNSKNGQVIKLTHGK